MPGFASRTPESLRSHLIAPQTSQYPSAAFGGFRRLFQRRAARRIRRLQGAASAPSLQIRRQRAAPFPRAQPFGRAGKSPVFTFQIPPRLLAEMPAEYPNSTRARAGVHAVCQHDPKEPKRFDCRRQISRNLCNLRNRSPLGQSVFVVGLDLISPLPPNAEAAFGPTRTPAYRLGFPFLAPGFRLRQDALRLM
jgi:hypothetical protein